VKDLADKHSFLAGFNCYGNERLHCGITGREFEAEILNFIGSFYHEPQ